MTTSRDIALDEAVNELGVTVFDVHAHELSPEQRTQLRRTIVAIAAHVREALGGRQSEGGGAIGGALRSSSASVSRDVTSATARDGKPDQSRAEASGQPMPADAVADAGQGNLSDTQRRVSNVATAPQRDPDCGTSSEALKEDLDEPCSCGKHTLKSWWASITDAGDDGTDYKRHARDECLTRTERDRRRAPSPPPATDATATEGEGKPDREALGRAAYEAWCFSNGDAAIPYGWRPAEMDKTWESWRFVGERLYGMGRKDADERAEGLERDLRAEMDGRAKLRARFGARPDETFGDFVARLSAAESRVRLLEDAVRDLYARKVPEGHYVVAAGSMDGLLALCRPLADTETREEKTNG